MLTIIKNAHEYYKENGLYKTIKRSLEVLIEIFVSNLVSIIPIPNILIEKFYFAEKGYLKKIKESVGFKIGVCRFGGIGDSIVATSMVTAIKEKWPDASIFLFVRSESQKKLLINNKDIDRIIVISKRVDLNSLLQIKMIEWLTKKYFDVIFLDRYVVKIFFKKGILNKSKEDIDELFKKYNINFYNFPLFSNTLLIYHKNEYELRSATTKLNISPHKLSIILNDRDFDILKNLPKNFFTIHHGSDNEWAQKENFNKNEQTKNWFVDRWEQVVAYLNRKGYKVIQLGTIDEKYINGTIDLRGKTTLTEAACILKQSILHLDTEGGLVHLAKSVKTKSLVLFGPTSILFYGYKDNINIRSGDCKDCWWSKPDWAFKCPRGFKVPKCMDSIKAEKVISAIDTYLNTLNRSKTQKYELINFSLFDGNLIEEKWEIIEAIYNSAQIPYKNFKSNAYNTETGAYIHGSKNWEYIYCVDLINNFINNKKTRILDAGACRGALQIYLAENNYEVFSCDYNYNDLSPANKNYGKIFLRHYHNKIKFRTASIFNLPYEDNFFDVVYCISVIEHFREKKYALKELLRVLKPDGLLILTFDITTVNKQLLLQDQNRIEIFNENTIHDLFLSELNIEIKINENDIIESSNNIYNYGIEGIPRGLTVGGLCIKKIN